MKIPRNAWEARRLRPGMVLGFWMWPLESTLNEIENIRADLRPGLGLKYDYGSENERFYRVYKLKGHQQ
jgi:hypothetical protein